MKNIHPTVKAYLLFLALLFVGAVVMSLTAMAEKAMLREAEQKVLKLEHDTETLTLERARQEGRDEILDTCDCTCPEEREGISPAPASGDHFGPR